MKEVVYIQRNPKAGFSIKKVFEPIINYKPNTILYEVPFRDASLKSLLRNIYFIFSKREKNKIYHITGDIHYGILGLIGKTTVLSIHDTVGLDFNPKGNHLKYKLGKFLWYTLPLKLATKVVCISESTREALKKYTKREDIEVIHNCVDPKIEFKEGKNISSKFNFLIIGTKKNKNIERVIEALAPLNCKLTIIGNLSKEQLELLRKYKIDYDNMTNLNDKKLYSQYHKADCVIFCSLFEGFGMPIVEANKAGVPIICSDISVLHEIANDSALFANPYKIESIRFNCMEIIHNMELRKSLIEKGLKNVERFDVNHIYSEWEKLYSSL